VSNFDQFFIGLPITL